MTTRRIISRAGPVRNERGYLMVMFVIIVAFVGAVAAMQVLVLTSVGTTSRAYDAYRQGATELVRLERAVAEAVLEQRQVSVADPTHTLSEALDRHVANMSAGGATVTVTRVPAALPVVTTFPNAGALAEPLAAVSAEWTPYLTPESAMMAGPRIAEYPEVRFEFSSERNVLDGTRTYWTEVAARLMAVPLTRFPITAYDLPFEIGSTHALTHAAPPSAAPAGLVPSRDSAFLADLQSQTGTLSYHYRRRATLAAAYQYVFSQRYIDRVAEYAGITHYHDLAAGGGTAVLAGMSRVGTAASWDLGVAGSGTYDTVTMARDAAVLFTEEAGHALRLHDTVGNTGASAMLILALGPSNRQMGPLTLKLATIARPVVIVGYNVRVIAAAGVAVNGALFLDPASTMTTEGALTVGHLSYWAGADGIAADAVAAGTLAASAETIAPRVVYVATTATRQ